MTQFPALTRRAWLAGAAGVTLAFSGRAAFGQIAERPKLVVIIARGAMDGLSVVVPHGDPAYVGLRGPLAIAAPGASDAALSLDGDFGLHPSLTSLYGLHQAGQARFAPAAALPTRLRSHFDAQDVLETGGAAVRAETDGWLNRALQATGASALAVGAQTPLILRGAVTAASWSPGGRGRDDARLATALQDLYADDPLLGPALARGLEVETQAAMATAGLTLRRNDSEALGTAVARFMIAADGPDVVALSLDGYDTHARQGAATGLLAGRLEVQDGLISGLRTGLGQTWRRTVLIVATEFGRTARINGTLGTDHGTASSMLLAGGALKPGGLIGDWPGLADDRLFEGRDLAPTLDIRSVFKGVLRDHLGVDRAALDAKVFPNSTEAPALTGLV